MIIHNSIYTLDDITLIKTSFVKEGFYKYLYNK